MSGRTWSRCFAACRRASSAKKGISLSGREDYPSTSSPRAGGYGYTREHAWSRSPVFGEGGIIDGFFPPATTRALDFFGDTLESIRVIDVENQISFSSTIRSPSIPARAVLGPSSRGAPRGREARARPPQRARCLPRRRRRPAPGPRTSSYCGGGREPVSYLVPAQICSSRHGAIAQRDGFLKVFESVPSQVVVGVRLRPNGWWTGRI